MGEKRAYKSRKPGGGRKKLKPEYDAGKNLEAQMDAAVALYEEDCSLQSIADALALNPIKVRKSTREYSSFRCCWKQMVWQQEKTISLKDGMMPRKMQLSFRLKKMNKVPSRLKSVQLDITSTWTYNTSKWT